MKPTKPRIFNAGDLVVAREFTDSSGVFHAESTVLVVLEISMVDSSCPHYRLKAGVGDGRQYIEAAERYFRHFIPKIGRVGPEPE